MEQMPSPENNRSRNTGMESIKLGHFALTEREKEGLSPEERAEKERRINEANARLMEQKSEDALRKLEASVLQAELEREAREKLQKVFGSKKESSH